MTVEPSDDVGVQVTPVDPTDGDVAAATIEKLSPLIAADEELQTRMQAIVAESISEITHHSGPLPRARDLAEYQQIDTSFAERIVRMAEKEQAHRHALPMEFMDREYRLKSRGQHYALTIAVIVLAFAAYIAWLGSTSMAGTVALGTLIGLVGIFVSGRKIDETDGRNRDNDE